MSQACACLGLVVEYVSGVCNLNDRSEKTSEPSCPGILRKITTVGVSYAMFSPHEGEPGPTLLLLAMDDAGTLSESQFNRVGCLLHAQGWNVVSLDLPCHGADRRGGEPEQLLGWAARTRAGEDIVAPFCGRVNDLIDHLVSTGIADPARLAIAGTSRGGFMAFHAAACNLCIRAVAAFAPVTDLAALSEFAGLIDNPLVRRLALLRYAEVLAGCAAWITIGDADARVDTGKAVAFAKALQESGDPGCERVLSLRSTPGHSSFPEWHDAAADWLNKIVLTNAHDPS